MNTDAPVALRPAPSGRLTAPGSSAQSPFGTDTGEAVGSTKANVATLS